MKRRMFILGMGSATAGGSALLGTGAFTSVQAHRTVEIEVAGDEEAYLGLLANAENPVATDLVAEDGDGHLELTLDSINEHADTDLDGLFRICNNGKQPVCVWLEKEGEVVQCTQEAFPGDPTSEERDAIRFYRNGDPEATIDSAATGVVLPIGGCLPVGVDLCTTGVDEGTELLPDGVTVYADADAACGSSGEGNGDGELLPGISFVAFCGTDLAAADLDFEVTDRKEDGDPIEVEWEYTGSGTVGAVVLKAGTWFYNFYVDGADSGTARVGNGEIVGQFADDQSPSEPCPDGENFVKFEFDGEEND